MVPRYTNWQREQAACVNNEIKALLASLPATPDFIDMVREPIAELTIAKGHGLKKPWHLLPLVVCECLSGRAETAIPAGAAIQLFMAAGEVFDDVEDADTSGSISDRYGEALAVNVATTLLILAERAVTRLKERNVADHTVIRITDAVNSFYARACCGQHKDLSSHCNSATSEEDYLFVSSMKSATTMECACHIGALIATEQEGLIDLFTSFGHNLGMASQIANDIQGIVSGRDILQKKVTLPVIYALGHGTNRTRTQLTFKLGKEYQSVSDTTEVKERLFRSGAIFYAMTKMEIYKHKASDILQDLEKTHLNTERLKSFLN